MARPKTYLSIGEKLWRTQGDAFIQNNALPMPLREIVAEIARLAAQHPHRLVDRETICDGLRTDQRRFNKGILSANLAYFKNAHLLRRTKHALEDAAVDVDTIVDLASLGSSFEKKKKGQVKVVRRTALAEQSAIEEISASSQFLPGLPPESVGRHEGLMTGILDSAVRLSPKDTRKYIEGTYRFPGGESISIRTMTLTGDREITVLSDQRVMRALNQMFIDHVEQRFGKITELTPAQIKEVDGRYAFDLNDLLRQLGYEQRASNRQLVREMLNRLRDTTYEIDASNSEYFRNRYSLSADEVQYRYLIEFYSKKEMEQVDDEGQVFQHNNRYYVIEFHSVVLHNLLTLGESFNSHPGLTQEKSGLAQRLSNWSKAYVGVRRKTGKQDLDERYVYTLREFHERVMPSAHYFNFERDLVNLLRRETTTAWSESGPNVSRIYGYFYQFEINEEKSRELIRKRRLRMDIRKPQPVITIWRDREDMYVGDNSMHSQALRRQARLYLEQEFAP